MLTYLKLLPDWQCPRPLQVGSQYLEPSPGVSVLWHLSVLGTEGAVPSLCSWLCDLWHLKSLLQGGNKAMHVKVFCKIYNMRCVFSAVNSCRVWNKSTELEGGRASNLPLQHAMLSHIWFRLEYSFLLFTSKSGVGLPCLYAWISCISFLLT